MRNSLAHALFGLGLVLVGPVFGAEPTAHRYSVNVQQKRIVSVRPSHCLLRTRGESLKLGVTLAPAALALDGEPVLTYSQHSLRMRPFAVDMQILGPAAYDFPAGLRQERIAWFDPRSPEHSSIPATWLNNGLLKCRLDQLDIASGVKLLAQARRQERQVLVVLLSKAAHIIYARRARFDDDLPGDFGAIRKCFRSGKERECRKAMVFFHNAFALARPE